jgi:hypothetical protein
MRHSVWQKSQALFFMPNFAVRNLSGEKGRPSFREVVISKTIM